MSEGAGGMIQAAAALAAAGNYRGAIAQIERALSAQPNDPHLLTVHADYCRRAGDLQQAARSATAALAIDPNLPDAHSVMTAAYIRSEMHTEALASAQQAIALKPDEPRHHRVLSLALFAAGRWSEAEASLRTALALAPEDLDSRMALAQVYITTNRLHEATDVVDGLLRRAPDSGLVHATAANLADALGRDRDADDHLSAALQNVVPYKAYQAISALLAARRNPLARLWLAWHTRYMRLHPALRILLIATCLVGGSTALWFWGDLPVWAQAMFGTQLFAIVLLFAGRIAFVIVMTRALANRPMRSDF